MFNPIRLEAYNPGPMTGPGNNTYLLVGSQGEGALIDAGVGDSRHLAAIGQHLGDARARLDHILVTHAHADHASGASVLLESYGAARCCKFPWPDEDWKYAVRWEPLADGDRLLAGGEPLVVLHTPGHSPDHIVFWHEPSRTAFTGDLVVQGTSVMIQWSRGGDLRLYLRSLDRVLALGPRRLLPAHGPEIAEPAALLNQYLDHRRMRERQVLDALARGRDTVQSIADCIYDGLDPALLPAARENVRAHLEKLRAEGLVFEESDRWSA
jgi:glyoxylase-like metal-dependent hydrolase (beta-lactamase superfamily II)